jgi:hypothetical protein
MDNENGTPASEENVEVVQDEPTAEHLAEVAKNQKIRAEKAEKAQKELEEKNKALEAQLGEKKSSADLSQKDLLALVRAEVHEEDMDDVVSYATFKKISVADALKDSVVKTILSDKSEARKSAQASNTGMSRKPTSTPSDDVLLSKLSKGEVPEAGSKEAEQLFWARRGGKK